MIELNPDYEANIDKFGRKYRAEIFAIGLSFIGTSMIAKIGIDFFNNRYISIPFLIFIAFGYFRMKREQAHGR